MAAQPLGTVTLLFSDIEGSTRLLSELGRVRYAEVLESHHRLMREAFAQRGGYEVDNEGDAFFVAFQSAADAVAAAVEAQQALTAFGWPEGRPVRVRIGIHTGEPLAVPPKYVGLEVHRAARIMATAHGGQVVLSETTAQLAAPDLPADVSLRDLGEHRVRDFEEPVHLFQLGEAEFPALRAVASRSLPTPASSFLGREAELAEADLLLLRSRLLTVIGPGGQGKTRFALELAERAREQRFDDYRDGVFFVSLAPLRDPQLVLDATRTALGAGTDVAAHVGEKRMLILLDNFEHLIEAAPELGSLLRACPNLTVLVTSRELLRIDGERTYDLPPLQADEGIALFCERAGIEPAGPIAELCRRLEGLPLAIELAAARARAVSPERLLERLSERLDLFRGGRDADARQQTLRATIAWSHDLLPPAEQELFARLSVFAGGCTLEAAEQVAEADLDTLQSLIDKSLLRHGEDRYWMLQTIREYAAERLEESPSSEQVRHRHAQHYVALAETLEPDLYTGGRRAAALAQLDLELPNIRAARSALEESRGFTDSLRLGTSLWRYWMARGSVAEARDWISTALTAAEPVPDGARAHALEGLSVLAAMQGEDAQGLELAEASLELYRRLEDGRGVRETLNNMGTLVYSLGDMQRAELMLDECAALSRVAGDEPTLALAVGNLAGLALERREYGRAAELATEAIRFYKRIGDEARMADASIELGEALLLQGEPAGAAREFQSALTAWSAAAQLDVLPMALIGLAATLCEAGEDVPAARLAAAADGVLTALGGSWARAWRTERELRDCTITTLRARLGDDAFARETAAGRELTPEAAVAYALGTAAAAAT